MVKISNTLVEKALRKYNGNISTVARSLGVTRSAIYWRIQKDAKLKEVWQETRETFLDNTETALADAVNNREGWAVCFTLKTIGKNRGYVEKQEIAHSGGVGVTIVDDIK